MLESLKSFNKSAANLDELIELSAFGSAFKAECGELGAQVPKWLDDKLSAVRREIASRIEAEKAHRRQQIHAELRGLRTADERRADLRKELESLGESQAEAAQDKQAEPAAAV